MAGPDGQPRSHWLKLVNSFEKLTAPEFASRRESAYRILREHGVTYNVYGDEQGLGRPWALDLVPLVMSAGEWRAVEAGLVQRARLLNLILADFYGPQKLLREGGLPAAVLFANPGFLRQCHGMRPPNDVYIFLHAVDIARSPSFACISGRVSRLSRGAIGLILFGAARHTAQPASTGSRAAKCGSVDSRTL